MILTIIITILLLVVAFKVSFFLIGACGKLLGFLLSLLGYAVIGGIVVGLLGAALVFIPLIFIVGIVTIIMAICSL